MGQGETRDVTGDGTVGRAGREACRDATWDVTVDATWDATWDVTGDATWDATGDAIGDATGDAIGDATGDARRVGTVRYGGWVKEQIWDRSV